MTKSDMPLVYICSPYSGDVGYNVRRAQEYCRYAVERGVVPIAPHLLFPQFMSDETEWKLAIQMNFVLLQKCSELWTFGSTISNGMAAEIKQAEKLNIKVRHFEVNAFSKDELKATLASMEKTGSIKRIGNGETAKYIKID